MIQEGSGDALIPAICESRRALVFISVPWSAPERHARDVFNVAARRLAEEYPELDIHLFRLEVDEDEPSQRWLNSLGLDRFAGAGAGSVIWLEGGRLIAGEITANDLGVAGVCSRSISLWTEG